MRCKHCFAVFDDVGHDNLSRDDMLAVVADLARGFQRINFVGGEPTLCPWLVDALQLARSLGADTSLVTNGTAMIGKPVLREAILARVDWLGLSIDSASPDTNRRIGRTVGHRVLATEDLVTLADHVHRLRVGLKVNTVVQSANVTENFHALLRRLRPDRWKVLRVLPIGGQNDADFAALTVTTAEFLAFVARHHPLAADGITLVPEDHEAMTGSYAMVDPGGYAYDNVDGRYRYSDDPVHHIGCDAAFAQVRLLAERFVARGGVYGRMGVVR